MSYLVYWRSYVLILAPLLFLPLPLLIDHSAARCAYVILIMASYWTTEAVHISVTALIPIFAFPLMGVLSTKEVCAVYMKDTNMLFFGGLAIAVAVEHCRMHERIALHILIRSGGTLERLLLGFMITQMFLSMWISNTAATAMMVPIVDAILKKLSQHGNKRSSSIQLPNEEFRRTSKSSMEMQEFEFGEVEETEPGSEDTFLRDTLYLGVAYASNIGGTGSLTGTNPNLVLMGFLNLWYSDNSGINYATWIFYNVPGMVIATILAYLYLRTVIFLHKRKQKYVSQDESCNIKNILEVKLKELGPFSFQEAIVLFLFFVAVCLWLFRKPEFIDGWGSIVSERFNINVGGATPGMLIVFLLFVVPSKPFWVSARKADPRPSPGCLTWTVLHHRLQWGVLMLIGGGFAIAEAGKKSGLSAWMGGQFMVFSGFPKGWTLLIICIITAALTEIMSNTAVSSILIPILNNMALSLRVHPLYFLMPVTLCSSYAFMLPVATPPNAIVFDAARTMPLTRMMMIGSLMNIVCIFVAFTMINTLGVSMFDLNNFPEWANVTAPAV